MHTVYSSQDYREHLDTFLHCTHRHRDAAQRAKTILYKTSMNHNKIVEQVEGVLSGKLLGEEKDGEGQRRVHVPAGLQREE